MQEPTLFIGVDVSRAELVISMSSERRPCSVVNDEPSIEAWLREVPSGAHIAMESTGRYHTLLAHLASQAGFKVYVLNAATSFSMHVPLARAPRPMASIRGSSPAIWPSIMRTFILGGQPARCSNACRTC